MKTAKLFFTIIYLISGVFLIHGQETKYKIKLVKELCSSSMDFAPRLLNKEGTQLIYTSSKENSVMQLVNLYYTEKRGDDWSKPKALIHKKESYGAGVPSIDSKRNVMFFTKCNAFENQTNDGCKIYYAFLSGDLLGEYFLLEMPLPDTDKQVTLGHPYFSNELDILLFVSDLPGGQGDMDIWYSKYDRYKDSWSYPTNLGPEINTDKSELYPSISNDNSLYISTTGYDGFGGMDIFRCNFKGKLKWNSPKNIGEPINSSSDDFGIEFKASSNSGFFTSNRLGGVGEDDIYSFNISSKENQDLIFNNDEYNDDRESIYNSIYSTLNSDECTQLKDELRILKYNVYPNPNNGDFTFDFTSNRSDEVEIRIYSSLGAILHSELKKVTKGETTLQFDFPQAKQGIYYIQLLQDCNILTSSKIIIR